MLYRGYYVKITVLKNILRKKRDGNIVPCNGYQIEIFSDKLEKAPVDVFNAAVEFEMLTDSIIDAEQFAMEVIDSEEKEYLKMLEEYSNSN